MMMMMIPPVLPVTVVDRIRHRRRRHQQQPLIIRRRLRRGGRRPKSCSRPSSFPAVRGRVVVVVAVAAAVARITMIVTTTTAMLLLLLLLASSHPTSRFPTTATVVVVAASSSSSSSSSSPKTHDDEDDEIDFPPLLDSEDIRYYAENYDLDGLHWALSNVFQRSARNPKREEIKFPQLPHSLVSKGGGSSYTTKYKLQMDLEQAEYLVENLVDKTKVAYLRDVVIPTYLKVLRRIPPLEELERTNGLYAFRPQDVEEDGITEVYNKAIHLTDFDETKDTRGNIIPLLNEKLDPQSIEAKWFGLENGDDTNDDQLLSRPGVVVIDDILSPEALQRIRQLMLESQVFYQTKMPLKFGGYAGAYIDDGLHDRILLQLAFELSKALPRIIGRQHPLKYLWAYKYDSEYTGISTHADQAAVNVNIWLTPTHASLDQDHGGLVVFTAKPPLGSDFMSYNTNVERAVEEILKPTKFANVTVPYRYNRAVMFDSALFHQTDVFKFKNGYKNRRINLTILYGEMQQQQASDQTQQEL